MFKVDNESMNGCFSGVFIANFEQVLPHSRGVFRTLSNIYDGAF